MTSLGRWGAGGIAVWLTAACGGAAFSSAGGSKGDSGAGVGQGPAPGVDAMTDDGSFPSDSTPWMDAKAADSSEAASPDAKVDAGDAASASDTSVTSDAPVAPCPDVRGSYSITAQGPGCGDLNPSAPQCIRQVLCGITFRSSSSGGTLPAINGDALLQSGGSFTNAMLTEGSVDRAGCTATWSTATSIMIVTCGGAASTQSCVAELRRTSALVVCN